MDILDTISISVAPAAQVNALRFGKFDSAGVPAQCGAGDPCDGIIQYTTDAGGVTIMYDGILPVAAAGALAAGTEVASDANGRAVAAVGTNALGRMVNGSTAAALDDIIEIQFYRRPQRVGGQNLTPALLLVDGAIPVRPSAVYEITKASAAALTLAAPTAGTDDGVTIEIRSRTAFAHVITATGLLQTGSAAVNTATFAAFAGSGLILKADNGKWQVVTQIGQTFA